MTTETKLGLGTTLSTLGSLISYEAFSLHEIGYGLFALGLTLATAQAFVKEHHKRKNQQHIAALTKNFYPRRTVFL